METRKKTDPQKAIRELLNFRKEYKQLEEEKKKDKITPAGFKFPHISLYKHFGRKSNRVGDPFDKDNMLIYLDEQDWLYFFNKYKDKVLENKDNDFKQAMEESIEDLKSELESALEFIKEIESIEKF